MFDILVAEWRAIFIHLVGSNRMARHIHGDRNRARRLRDLYLLQFPAITTGGWHICMRTNTCVTLVARKHTISTTGCYEHEEFGGLSSGPLRRTSFYFVLSIKSSVYGFATWVVRYVTYFEFELGGILGIVPFAVSTFSRCF